MNLSSMRLVLLLLSVYGILLSCKATEKQEASAISPPANSVEIEAEDTEFTLSDNAKLLAKSRVFKRGFTHNGLGFLIDVKNGTKARVSVRSNGLDELYQEVFDLDGQLVDAYYLDLNNDLFKELYLVVRPTDNSTLELIVISSNGRKNASPLSIDPSILPRSKNPNRIYTKQGRLFHVFDDEEKSTFEYEMIENDGKYHLKAKEL